MTANQPAVQRRALSWLSLAAALGAFAANSILCRLALAAAAIDAASFTALRVGAGALVLALAAGLGSRRTLGGAGSWRSAIALFGYAAAFSFAYLTLTAATGALILFAAVQLTMLGAGFGLGERPHALQWIGISVAAAGLVWLVLPGLAAPDPRGAILMALAGVSWAVYSLRGRRVPDALGATAGNFVRAAPLALPLLAAIWPGLAITPAGAAWALLSGAVTSGLGYVAWYAAVRGLSATRAAVVQLPVPVLTAVAGVLLLGETVSLRLVVAGVGILGGVGLALSRRERQACGT